MWPARFPAPDGNWHTKQFARKVEAMDEKPRVDEFALVGTTFADKSDGRPDSVGAQLATRSRPCHRHQSRTTRSETGGSRLTVSAVDPQAGGSHPVAQPVEPAQPWPGRSFAPGARPYASTRDAPTPQPKASPHIGVDGRSAEPGPLSGHSRGSFACPRPGSLTACVKPR